VFACLIHVHDIFVVGLGRARARVRRAHFHPLLQRGYQFRGKLPVVGRHLQILVLVTDGLDEEAFLGVARMMAGPVSPPLSRSSRVSSRNPPLIFSLEWLWHL